MPELREQIEREVRQQMSRDSRESAIVDLILEQRAEECEATVMLDTEQACQRARELRAMKGNHA